MTVVHHDNPNGIPVTPTMPATGQLSLGVSPVVLGLDSKPIFETCIRIDIQRPGNDASPYPIKALLTNFIKEIQKVDPANMILPINPASKHGTLMLTSDIPADENGVTTYFGGFQDAYGCSPMANKTLRVFVRIRSAQSLPDLKFNTGFFSGPRTTSFLFILMGAQQRMMLAPPVLLVGCLPPFTATI